MLKWIYYLLFICCIGFACSPTKHIPEGDALYTGASVKLSAENIDKRQHKVIESDLEGLTRPKPNARFLGIPFKLMLWNLFYTENEDSFFGKLQRKLGEPPVLASTLDLEANNVQLQTLLENRGFFNARVTGDSTWKGDKASASYDANAGHQYKINSVVFEQDSTSELLTAIRDISKQSLLQPGEPYNLDLIKGELTRIDASLKERGFYYFSPEFLLVQVDSTLEGFLVDMRVVVKPDVPDEARQKYYINDVFVYSNYSLNTARRDTNLANATFYNGYYVVDPENKYKPKLFTNTMQFAPNEIYNRTDHNRSLQRLINLNVFKFVKNRFERAAVDSPKLNAYYYLTPQTEKALRAEVGANTKSNNLNGSELSFGFQHRNAFRGGEQMDLRLYVGTEAQFNGSFQGTSTFRVGGELNFAIPRFVAPFIKIKTRSGFVPKTNIRLGYEALNRKTLYTLNSFSGGIGYLWKTNMIKSHEFYPISINYVQPLNITDKYQQDIVANPTLQHITDTQFIMGATYLYNYNQAALGTQRTNSFYFNALADVSGNLAGLVVPDKRLFGLPFSQYLKLELDGRYYRKIGLHSTWANRVVLGFGMPYGNSGEIPYVKQYFTGGNNSIRAFRSRTVGPGSYEVRPTSQGFIPDQTGDLKLELNTEYRPKISGPLYGALFVDAGNIWLKNENPLKPGAKFDSDFLSELAVGTGAGIRLDIQIFVIRLDVAFPIRKPWLPKGERWTFDQIKFGDPEWRSNNIIYNLAIGYPF